MATIYFFCSYEQLKIEWFDKGCCSVEYPPEDTLCFNFPYIRFYPSLEKTESVFWCSICRTNGAIVYHSVEICFWGSVLSKWRWLKDGPKWPASWIYIIYNRKGWESLNDISERVFTRTVQLKHEVTWLNGYRTVSERLEFYNCWPSE